MAKVEKVAVRLTKLEVRAVLKFINNEGLLVNPEELKAFRRAHTALQEVLK